MEIHEHVLPITNKLMEDYLGNGLHRSSDFHYSPYDYESYSERITELKKYTFPRIRLVEHLTIFNQRYQADKNTIENIKKLEDPNTLVVVGGQQAGILTGPLYTINKIVTIIQQAKLIEERHQTPVIPVFWIAGEDHDFPEINHTYTEVNGKMKKHSVQQKWPNKHSVSDVQLDHQACQEWINELFSFYGETSYTNEILEEINKCLQDSNTYVDFFAKLIFLLFKETGLVLVDSGNEQLRELEIPVFETILRENAAIDSALKKQQQTLKDRNISLMIDSEENSAHIFYHLHGERVLLERMVEEGNVFYRGKNNECRFSEKELLALLHEHPNRFSNNVVTRPIMQEYLFPTIMFVAGPGEIAYWAELKQVFEGLDRKMPPVFPRLMTTVILRSVLRDINEMDMSIPSVLLQGVSKEKQEFLEQIKDSKITNEIQLMKVSLKNHYETLSYSATAIHDSLTQMVSKNEALIHKQLDFLETEFYKHAQRKNEVILQRFDRIQHLVRPENHPQERMINIFYFINLFGFSIISQILNETSSSEYSHKVLYM
ncbi:bacillithiol biosynthesis cysteine-adding enzyme BshC [Bacillus pinisoli]|uniref:bacillithiol biosynthesis cysteine-adding enzyme BshC n=1 Tax=Bacillus pinisoli TaxID=2901866 RepID=UPI001FF5ACDC|nr:bacillithiol biosynthesis cysteine-adding enzyme BshC [Bacillus pinisoli]